LAFTPSVVEALQSSSCIMASSGTEDLTMEQLWDEAAERFLARTGKGLNRKPPMTIDDVRKQIESRTDPTTDIDAANTLKHKKDIGLNILECLKLLGGIAAQGASVVTRLRPD